VLVIDARVGVRGFNLEVDKFRHSPRPLLNAFLIRSHVLLAFDSRKKNDASQPVLGNAFDLCPSSTRRFLPPFPPLIGRRGRRAGRRLRLRRLQDQGLQSLRLVDSAAKECSLLSQQQRMEDDDDPILSFYGSIFLQNSSFLSKKEMAEISLLGALEKWISLPFQPSQGGGRQAGIGTNNFAKEPARDEFQRSCVWQKSISLPRWPAPPACRSGKTRLMPAACVIANWPKHKITPVQSEVDAERENVWTGFKGASLAVAVAARAGWAGQKDIDNARSSS